MMNENVYESSVSLNASFGASILNAIRQAVMYEVPVVRPIAVKLGGNANLLTAGSFVEEDTAEFIANILELNFQVESEDSFYESDGLLKQSYFVKKVLRDTDLDVKSKIIVSNANNRELLHVLADTEITVYYRYASGSYSRLENSDFLEEQNVSLDGLAVLNSRHSPIDSFTVNEIESDSPIHEFKIAIKCVNGYQAEKILGTAADILDSTLQKFY